MAKIEKPEGKDQNVDKSSKKSNFYEIDGSLEINEITAKIDAFLNV